jgi:hypothetical protein
LGCYKVVVQANKDKTTTIIGLLNQMNQPKPLFALSMHCHVVVGGVQVFLVSMYFFWNHANSNNNMHVNFMIALAKQTCR